MNRAIVIIHSSELVRKGLVTIFENKFSARIICVSYISELEKTNFFNLNEVVFLLESTFEDFNTLFTLRVKTAKFTIVGLTEKQPKIKSAFFDLLFSIYEPTNQLVEIISEFFSKNNQDNAEDELTIREKEVLRLIAIGFTNKTIAEKLFISTHTVISHRKNITEKLGIKSIPGLTVYAIIQNIVNTSEITPDQLF